jgi:hypothetical protein
VLAVLALSSLSGCAIGVTHDYQRTPIDLRVATTATVAVVTVDDRPYVLDGQKESRFVGLSRGGYGNPFDMSTESGNPLSRDISTALVEAMKRRDVKARLVKVRPGSEDSEVIARLRASGAQRSVWLTLREWKADSMLHVSLAYDFDCRIIDETGAILVSKTRTGKDRLGDAAVWTTPGGEDLAIAHFKKIMEELFRDREVAKALQH